MARTCRVFNARAERRQVQEQQEQRKGLGQEHDQGPPNGSPPFLTPPSPDQPPPPTTQQLDFQPPEVSEPTTSSLNSYESSQSSSLLSLSTLPHADEPNPPTTSSSYQETSHSLVSAGTLSSFSVSTTLPLTISTPVPTTTIDTSKEITTPLDSKIIPTIISCVLGVIIPLFITCAVLWLRGRRKNDGAETRESWIQQPIVRTLRIPPISSQDRNYEAYGQSHIPERLIYSPPSTPLSNLVLTTGSASLVANAVPLARGDIDEYLDVAPASSYSSSIVWSELSTSPPI